MLIAREEKKFYQASPESKANVRRHKEPIKDNMKYLGASVMQRAAEERSGFQEQETREEIQEIKKIWK